MHGVHIKIVRNKSTNKQAKTACNTLRLQDEYLLQETQNFYGLDYTIRRSAGRRDSSYTATFSTAHTTSLFGSKTLPLRG